MTRQLTGCLLSRQWRDVAGGVAIDLWFATADGSLCAHITGEQSVFFLPAEQWPKAERLLAGERGFTSSEPGLRDFSRRSVRALYFPAHRQAREASRRLLDAGLEPLEADLNPADRYLMERFITGAATLEGAVERMDGHLVMKSPRLRPADYRPALRIASIDIETAMEGLELYSIAAHGTGPGGVEERRVFLRGPGTGQAVVQAFPTDRAVLLAFLDWLAAYDPDVITGWNVINFDLRFLQRLADRLGVSLTLGRDGRPSHWRPLDDDGERHALQVTGRLVIDGPEWLRAAFYRFESFALDNVAKELLGEGKLLRGPERGEEIGRLFREGRERLVDYNLRDCELVSWILEKTGLIQFCLARSNLTGLAADRSGGSVAAFDFLYLPRLHRRGFVAPVAASTAPDAPGGFVLDSRPGLYRHVLVLDFKSLYPSIIRTFNIDPLGLVLAADPELPESAAVPGFRGVRFARDGHILPDLIEQLWAQRDAAKRASDAPLSQAIKIIMNAFYGVLGSPGCRFFDPRLAASITLRGHEILNRTKDRIEVAGHTVIYGDTDSVFVWIQEAEDDEAAEAAGRELERTLNDWWRETLAAEFAVESRLELEFETHYRRFLMPTVRGSEKGSKKRYAGLVADGAGGDRLVFKGLENVRSDWTRLARQVQEELYGRIFREQPWEEWLRAEAAAVRAGERDDQLVYRKRLRRRLDDYQRNVPPHVQAARLAVERGLRKPHRGGAVRYVITTAGAEPADDPRAPLDYQHYIDRQLAPVADGMLHQLGTSFAEVVDAQYALF
ncbi:DNA polymerase II [Pseudohaliea sp.]|uniref:DNA polymerase II n=1 Tax=Pseudohaliea sp. TaxID=2740289 RepID=UPI0032EA9AB8